MEAILTALLFISIGFLMAIIPAIYIHRRHKQAWQSEYRRWMSGIRKCSRDVLDVNAHRAKISNQLIDMLHDNPTWPRS